jgi:hypothetical protein
MVQVCRWMKKQADERDEVEMGTCIWVDSRVETQGDDGKSRDAT